MKLVTLVSALCLTDATVLVSGHVLAKEVPSLYPRGSFQGGWPLEATSCPSNTTACGTTGACCPGSTNCYTEGLAGDAVCCPTTDDCISTARAIAICADPSWTLYHGNYNYFCCAQGQIGILPDASDTVVSGLCIQAGTNVAASELATAVHTLPGAGAAGTATASKSTPTTAGGAAGIVSSALGKITGGPPAQTTTATKSNDSAKSSSVSILGMIIGFLLIPFGM